MGGVNNTRSRPGPCVLLAKPRAPTSPALEFPSSNTTPRLQAEARGGATREGWRGVVGGNGGWGGGGLEEKAGKPHIPLTPQQQTQMPPLHLPSHPATHHCRLYSPYARLQPPSSRAHSRVTVPGGLQPAVKGGGDPEHVVLWVQGCCGASREEPWVSCVVPGAAGSHECKISTEVGVRGRRGGLAVRVPRPTANNSTYLMVIVPKTQRCVILKW